MSDRLMVEFCGHVLNVEPDAVRQVITIQKKGHYIDLSQDSPTRKTLSFDEMIIPVFKSGAAAFKDIKEKSPIDILGVADLCEAWNLSESRVKELFQTGKVKGTKVGERTWACLRLDADKYRAT